MKLPLSWIKETIDIQLQPNQIAKILTQAGLEVDSYTIQPLKFSKVIIGKVIRVEKHPNAEKLVVATVSDGTKEYQVVCGAPNCREGIKTAYATEGAIL
jgi:phenylalanyl-tRNA synthetase beta chain